MALFHLDTDVILSNSPQWKELDEKWGEPVDLDEPDEDIISQSSLVAGRLGLSCSDPSLCQKTFDSASYIAKMMNAKKITINLQENLKVCGEEKTLESMKNECEEYFKVKESGISSRTSCLDLSSLSSSSGSTHSSSNATDSDGYCGDVEF